MLPTTLYSSAEPKMNRKQTSESNFDIYLKEQLKDKSFAERFREAGREWTRLLREARKRENVGRKKHS